MTLAKNKPRRSPTPNRKRVARHHKQTRSYAQPYWPYLPIIAIITLGIVCNSWLTNINRSVLGYATSMSVSGLLSGTNDQRAANGLGRLALNSVLSQAAQNKANDMVARDYWSHNTPDGQAPWTFIVAVGYSYQTAGENLAYGFSTAGDTITGWMNSPGHRANILNTTFQEVGFGVANSPNYQNGGPETIVVAMYAQPTVVAAPAPEPSPAPAPTPAPAPVTTAPTTRTTPTPVATKQATPTTAPAPQAAPETPAETPTTQPAPAPDIELPKNATKQGDSPVAAKAADTVAPQKISRVQLLAASNVGWSQFAVSMVASIALLAFLLRHSLAWHKVLTKGEQFILHHPILDISFIALVVLGYILLQTTGTIR
ncbi:MAG: CAP domain-containing protein [Candidatus Saccharimonadales bacterium]